ncbi:hypothetical protein D3C77_612290 [compost metagenome]
MELLTVVILSRSFGMLTCVSTNTAVDVTSTQRAQRATSIIEKLYLAVAIYSNTVTPVSIKPEKIDTTRTP